MAIIEHPLDFERPIVEVEAELEGLRSLISAGDESKHSEYVKLEAKANRLRNEIYGKLTRYQRVQLSRHFDRPFALDYIKEIFSDFRELAGDRLFREDPAIVGGLARLGDTGVVVVGQQRGRTTAERLKRNFGMANPEGYRKALRLFRLAEKFNKPVITLIDTQGAYPGIEAEEHGQAEAIARNLLVLSELRTPVICVVIGEGGSGGALALAVGDRILMLENACYSVITPEGCASILYHKEGEEASPSQAATAAEMLQVTAQDLDRLKVIDEVVSEPLGGAHLNHKEAAESLRSALNRNLRELAQISAQELLERRYKKFRAFGPFSGGD